MIRGVPRHSEGARPEQFLHSWLQDAFGAEVFSASMIIDRAHRTPPRPASEGVPPRSLIAQILHFQDKVTILHIAREKGPL